MKSQTSQPENLAQAPNKPQFVRTLDAIAVGVKTRYQRQEIMPDTVTITEQTVAVAHRLGIPREEIVGWLSAVCSRLDQRGDAIRRVCQAVSFAEEAGRQDKAHP